MGFGPIPRPRRATAALVSLQSAKLPLLISLCWGRGGNHRVQGSEESGCDNSNFEATCHRFTDRHPAHVYAGAWPWIRCTLYVSFPVASPRCLSNGRTSSIVRPCFRKLTSRAPSAYQNVTTITLPTNFNSYHSFGGRYSVCTVLPLAQLGTVSLSVNV